MSGHKPGVPAPGKQRWEGRPQLHRVGGLPGGGLLSQKRDISVIKSTGFGFLHPHGSLQPLVIPAPGHLVPSGLLGQVNTRTVGDTQTHVQIKHSYIKINKQKEMNSSLSSRLQTIMFVYRGITCLASRLAKLFEPYQRGDSGTGLFQVPHSALCPEVDWTNRRKAALSRAFDFTSNAQFL